MNREKGKWRNGEGVNNRKERRGIGGRRKGGKGKGGIEKRVKQPEDLTCNPHNHFLVPNPFYYSNLMTL